MVNTYHKESPSGGSEEAPKDIKNTRERLYWAEYEHKVYLAEKGKPKQAVPKKKGGKR